MLAHCARCGSSSLSIYIINLEKYPAAVGVTRKNVYCGAVDWRTRVKFSGHVCSVIQQIVSSFEPGVVRGVGAARAHVRHRVNMGNGKIADYVKIDRESSYPWPVARQRVVVAICGLICWIVDGRTYHIGGSSYCFTCHVQHKTAYPEKSVVFRQFSAYLCAVR